MYEFGMLKEHVKTLIKIDPDQVESQFQSIKMELSFKDLEKNIEINSEGLFYKDQLGQKHKGFIYIEKGYDKRVVERKGLNTIIPKYHIANCVVIANKKEKGDFKDKFVFANTEIKMVDLDGKEKELEICGYCVQLHRNEVTKGMKTSDFIEHVLKRKDSRLGNKKELLGMKYLTNQFWAYTAPEDKVNVPFRIQKQFTCEDCGIQLNKTYADGYFLKTHHIDGDQKNNSYDNLKCLCVDCDAKEKLKKKLDDRIKQEISRQIEDFQIIKALKEKEKVLNYLDIISKGENKNVEFKSTFIWDVKLGGFENRKSIIHSVLKTICAFANSDGGELFIGVEDNGQIYGIEKDYQYFKKDKIFKDEYMKFFDEQLTENIGNMMHHYVKLDFFETQQRTVCVVRVKPSYVEPFSVKNPKIKDQIDYFMRRTGTTLPISKQEALDLFLQKKN